MTIRRKQYYNEPMRQKFTYDEWINYVFWFPAGDEMRLKFEGYRLLEKYFPCHTVDIVDNEAALTSKHLIFLARFCRQPYYIYGSDYIAFFDEEEAFIFKLCDGNIDNVEEVSAGRLSDD